MNKMRLGKSISVLSAGVISFIISLVLLIKSFGHEVYDDGSTDIYFSELYVIAILVGIIIVACGGYMLYATLKDMDSSFVSVCCGFVISVLVSFYSLGYFFKQITKKGGAGFSDVQSYFYIGLFALPWIVYFIFQYLSIKKK